MKNSTISKYINISYSIIIISIIAAFLISEFAVKGDNVFIVLFSVLKFLLVGFIFMEVLQAHSVWKILLVLFGLFYFSIILFFY